MPRGPEREGHFVVVDLEATCADDGSMPWPENEIIEIGAVMVRAGDLQIVDELQTFVRPLRHPELTDFCTRLTRIRQEDVDDAPTFAQALPALARWVERYAGPVFCSWGEYDKKLIALECRRQRVHYPFDDVHLDLKEAYREASRLPKAVGMMQAMRRAGLSHQGTLHRALDDARNVARLLPFIVREEGGASASP